MAPIVFADNVRAKDPFVAEVDRLVREVRQLGQQIERIEAQVRRAVNHASPQRFEEYR